MSNFSPGACGIAARFRKNRLFFVRPELKAFTSNYAHSICSFLRSLLASACLCTKPSLAAGPQRQPTPRSVATASPAQTPPPTRPCPRRPSRLSIKPRRSLFFVITVSSTKFAIPDTEITPAAFEEQMKELKDRGITVIGMQDFLAWKRGEKNIPPRCAVITFDDGLKSQYEVAWPI